MKAPQLQILYISLKMSWPLSDRSSDWLGAEGQETYDNLDWDEGEYANNFKVMKTKVEGAKSPECNEIAASKKFNKRVL